MNIVFIQLYWPLQECLISLLEPLSSNGANIFVCHSDYPSYFIDLNRKNSVNAVFLPVKVIGWPKLLMRYSHRMPRFISRSKFLASLWGRIFNDDFLFRIHQSTRAIRTSILENNITPDLIIGVEKYGLIAAKRLSEMFNTKYAFYSLELMYGDECPSIFWSIKRAEYSALENISHLIIQDKLRHQYLISKAPVNKDSTVTYLPVSAEQIIPQNQQANSSCPLVPSPLRSRRKAIYSGKLSHYDSFELLLERWSLVAGKYALILHFFDGHENSRRINQLEEIANNLPNVSIIKGMLSSSDHLKLINSCDIGLALYSGCHDANHTLIAKASQKVATYLMLSKPLLAIANPSFCDLFEAYACGETLDLELNELPSKLLLLDLDYRSYQAESKSAYHSFFDSDANGRTLFNDLLEVV